MKKILIKFKKELEQLINPHNKKFLLAFSGGKDSVVLLDLFLQVQQEYTLTIEIAYVNHNLRGKESTLEDKFVSRLITSKGLKLHKKVIAPAFWLQKKGQSLEMQARKIRYRFFKAVLEERKLDYIITAHHLQDRIETFFIQILRGAGPETLASIPARNGRILRPLLSFSLKELAQYQQQNDLAFIEDMSNAEPVYLRNKVRHSLLPELNKIVPHYETSINTLFLQIEEQNILLHKVILRLLRKITIFRNPAVWVIDFQRFLKCNPVIKKSLVKTIIKKMHYPAAYNTRFLNYLCQSHKRYAFKKSDLQIQSATKNLWFMDTRKKCYPELAITVDKIPYQYQNNDFKICIQKNMSVDKTKGIVLKYHNNLFPLRIRNAAEGDAIFVTGKEKPVFTILKQAGFPQSLWKQAIVIENNAGEIIAIKICHYHRICPANYITANENGIEFLFYN